ASAGETFRVGYLEGGNYWLFNRTFNAVKEAHEEKGWLDRISFPEKAYYSPGWDAGESVWNRKAQNLMGTEDLDLVIGMGTDGTRALLKENNGTTPILGMGVSNALKSGFIKSNEDSGIENFTVRIVPGRYKRMFEIFHQVIGFENLGLIYPDTESGRDYTNLESAREVAQEKGFEIVEYTLEKEDAQSCLKGLQALVNQGMDAFFIPSLLCFDWEKSDVDKLLAFLREKQIPTFARNGSRDVRAGALMGFSTIDFSTRGQFLADKMIRILEGAEPRDLTMVDDAVPAISLNIHVAQQIGFDPPFDILAATDEIYREIKLPEDRLVK
ncbi:MAG: hypothetical protein K9J83_08360, partial [Desulfarculaceae bacterium]|nr:hypothetical protein [Desulfarculaceae bacterium]